MKKELRPVLSQNLIKARNALRWTQKKAADMLGVQQKAYAAWEEGRANPDLKLLPLIAYNFKVYNLLAFLENTEFDPANQDEGWTIELATPLEEKYREAPAAAQAIVDLALGIGTEPLVC